MAGKTCLVTGATAGIGREPALEVAHGGGKVVLEGPQHIGNNRVRCLALGTTDGLARGVEVTDTAIKF